MIDFTIFSVLYFPPQGFEKVKEKYAELKKRAEQGSNLGAQGARITSAQLEANTLLEEAWSMMGRMGGKEYMYEIPHACIYYSHGLYCTSDRLHIRGL